MHESVVSKFSKQYRRNFSGSAIQVNFHIAEQILKPWFNVSVALSNDDKFEAIVPGCPDVAKIHLQTDKGVYRAGDTGYSYFSFQSTNSI